MSEAKIRAAFEAWATHPDRGGKLPIEAHGNGAYRDTLTYAAYYGWMSACKRLGPTDAWQPIEAAPKDFVTEVDGWNGERVPNIIWAHPDWTARGLYAWCAIKSDSQGSYCEEVRGLTHWMPIPKGPE